MEPHWDVHLLVPGEGPAIAGEDPDLAVQVGVSEVSVQDVLDQDGPIHGD
ncbi:MAG: hypothetical protein KDA87_18350 [Planctomycetales bacterium]|nr:hypothetical protein [Planctomycetales bacterium]